MVDSPDILIFSDKEETLNTSETLLAKNNFLVHIAPKDESGFKVLTNHKFDLIIVEMSQHFTFELNFIEKIHQLNSSIPLVIFPEAKREAKKTVFGASTQDLISDPFLTNKLNKSIHDAINPDKKQSSGFSLQQSPTDRLNKSIKFLFELSRSLNSVLEFDELLRTTIELTLQAFGASRATLFLLDNKKEELWSRVGTGLHKTTIRLPKNSGIVGEVVTTGIPIIANDPQSHSAFNKDFDEKTNFITKSVLCVPLKNLRGKVIGAFEVLNKISGEFDLEDQKLLTSVASTTALALENKFLKSELMKKESNSNKINENNLLAQKKIIEETKRTTIKEVSNYISELKEYDAVNSMFSRLKLQLDDDTEIKELTKKMVDSHNKLFTRLNQYLDKFNTDL